MMPHSRDILDYPVTSIHQEKDVQKLVKFPAPTDRLTISLQLLPYKIPVTGKDAFSGSEADK